MTENPDLERRLADLERRHDKTRGLLVDALTVAALVMIGFYAMPEGWHALILGFCGGFFIPSIIARLFLRDTSADGGKPQKRRATMPPQAPWRYLENHR